MKFALSPEDLAHLSELEESMWKDRSGLAAAVSPRYSDLGITDAQTGESLCAAMSAGGTTIVAPPRILARASDILIGQNLQDAGSELACFARISGLVW